MYGYGMGAPATLPSREANLLTYTIMGVFVAAVSTAASITQHTEATLIAPKPYTEADKVFTLSPADQKRVLSGIMAVVAAGGAGVAVGCAGALLRGRKEDEVPAGPEAPHQK